MPHTQKTREKWTDFELGLYLYLIGVKNKPHQACVNALNKTRNTNRTVVAVRSKLTAIRKRHPELYNARDNEWDKEAVREHLGIVKYEEYVSEHAADLE